MHAQYVAFLRPDVHALPDPVGMVFFHAHLPVGSAYLGERALALAVLPVAKEHWKNRGKHDRAKQTYDQMEVACVCQCPACHALTHQSTCAPVQGQLA